MVKLADLWQRKSAKGTVYFSGFMGDCQVLLFKEGKKAHPTKPDEEVIVWKLLVQERDPERRSQQQRERPPAHQAERGRGDRRGHQRARRRLVQAPGRRVRPGAGPPV
jgi:hypothetical protein